MFAFLGELSWPSTQFGLPEILSPPERSVTFAGTESLLLLPYIIAANCNCFMLLRQTIPCALNLDLAKTGKSRAASMAIIAITTNSSIKVKPCPFALETGRQPGPRFMFSVNRFITFLCHFRRAASLVLVKQPNTIHGFSLN